MRRWLGCWFCAARGLLGMEGVCVVTTCGVQNESVWTSPTGQCSLLTSWSTPGRAADRRIALPSSSGAAAPTGQRVRDPMRPGSDDPLQIHRTQPRREPSDFADERAHHGYACDRSGREWDSDLGVDCSIPGEIGSLGHGQPQRYAEFAARNEAQLFQHLGFRRDLFSLDDADTVTVQGFKLPLDTTSKRWGTFTWPPAGTFSWPWTLFIRDVAGVPSHHAWLPPASPAVARTDGA